MKYAKGDQAWGECARSGRRMLLKDMVADGYYPDLIVDPAWREERQPQEHLPGISDPEALYRPAPEDLPAPTSPVLTGTGIATGIQFPISFSNSQQVGTDPLVQRYHGYGHDPFPGAVLNGAGTLISGGVNDAALTAAGAGSHMFIATRQAGIGGTAFRLDIVLANSPGALGNAFVGFTKVRVNETGDLYTIASATVIDPGNTYEWLPALNQFVDGNTYTISLVP